MQSRNSEGGPQMAPRASSTAYQNFVELRLKNAERKNDFLKKQLKQSDMIIKTYEELVKSYEDIITKMNMVPEYTGFDPTQAKIEYEAE